MAIDLDLTKLNHISLITITSLLFSSLIAPGWYLFQFNPELFFKLDIFRLIIVCFGIGVALNFFNAFLVLVVAISDKTGQPANPEGGIAAAAVVGSVITSFVLYTPCIITFFAFVSVKWAYRIASITELVVFIFGIILIATSRDKK